MLETEYEVDMPLAFLCKGAGWEGVYRDSDEYETYRMVFEPTAAEEAQESRAALAAMAAGETHEGGEQEDPIGDALAPGDEGAGGDRAARRDLEAIEPARRVFVGAGHGVLPSRIRPFGAGAVGARGRSGRRAT